MAKKKKKKAKKEKAKRRAAPRAPKKEKKKKKKKSKKGLKFTGEIIQSGAANLGVIIATGVAGLAQGLAKRSGVLRKIGAWLGVSEERQEEAGQYAEAGGLALVELLMGPRYGKWVAPLTRAAMSDATTSTGRTIEALDSTFLQIDPSFVAPSAPLGLPALPTPPLPK